jgi:hypothetical protein
VVGLALLPLSRDMVAGCESFALAWIFRQERGAGHVLCPRIP